MVLLAREHSKPGTPHKHQTIRARQFPRGNAALKSKEGIP
jgi:hypothetical protein